MKQISGSPLAAEAHADQREKEDTGDQPEGHGRDAVPRKAPHKIQKEHREIPRRQKEAERLPHRIADHFPDPHQVPEQAERDAESEDEPREKAAGPGAEIHRLIIDGGCLKGLCPDIVFGLRIPDEMQGIEGSARREKDPLQKAAGALQALPGLPDRFRGKRRKPEADLPEQGVL